MPTIDGQGQRATSSLDNLPEILKVVLPDHQVVTSSEEEAMQRPQFVNDHGRVIPQMFRDFLTDPSNRKGKGGSAGEEKPLFEAFTDSALLPVLAWMCGERVIKGEALDEFCSRVQSNVNNSLANLHSMGGESFAVQFGDLLKQLSRSSALENASKCNITCDVSPGQTQTIPFVEVLRADPGTSCYTLIHLLAPSPKEEGSKAASQLSLALTTLRRLLLEARE